MKCTGIIFWLLLSVGTVVAQEKSVPDAWLGVKPNVSGATDATNEAQTRTTASVLVFEKQELGK